MRSGLADKKLNYTSIQIKIITFEMWNDLKKIYKNKIICYYVR